MEVVEFLAATEHDIEIRDMHDPAVAVAYIAGFGPDQATLTRAIFG